MNENKKILKRLLNLNSYSKLCLKLGAYIMFCFYFVSMFAYLLAPQSPNYLKLMAVHTGSLEAAPAVLVAGIFVALVCDLVVSSKESKE